MVRPASQMFIPESPYYNPDVTLEIDNPAAAKELSDAYCADVPDQLHGRQDQHGAPVSRRLRRPRPDRRSPHPGMGRLVQRRPSRRSRRTSTSRKLRSVSTTPMLWRRSAPRIRHSTTCGSCAARSAVSRSTLPKLCDPARDEALLAAQATEDQAERAELYKQVSQMIHDDYIYIYTSHTLWVNAFAENVHGVCDRVSPEGVPLRCVSLGRNWFSSIWISE